MILRLALLVLALGNSLTHPLFAGTDRGSRLISEGGGAQGVAGVAGPAGTDGIAGIAGAQGIQGIPGIPGAPGVLDYTDFYALMPTDNPAPIAANGPVSFPQIGSTTGVITSTGPSSFNLPTIGTYLVEFQVSADMAAQLALRLDGLIIANSVVGRATGTSQIVGMSLVTTTTVNSVLEVISTVGGLTITPLAGGTGAMPAPVSAHLTITRIQ